MNRTTRSLKKAVSVLAASALMAVSPGLMGARAFAQVVRVQVQPGLGALPVHSAGAGLLTAPGAGSRAFSGGLLAPSGLMEGSLPGIRTRTPSAAPAAHALAPAGTAVVPAAGRVVHPHAAEAPVTAPSVNVLAVPAPKRAARAETAAGLTSFSKQVAQARTRDGGQALKPVLDRTWEGSALRPSADMPVFAGGLHAGRVQGLRPSAGVLPGMKRAVPALKSSMRRLSPRTLYARARAWAGRMYQGSKERLRFVLTPRKIAVRFKRTTVVRGDISVEIGVQGHHIRAVLDELDLKLVRADKDGLLYVAPRDRRAPSGLADRLEEQQVVLYATPYRARAPRAKRLTLEFRKSILVKFTTEDGGGFYAEVGTGDDDIAEVLRRHGLRVIRQDSGLSFEVEMRRFGRSQDLARELAKEDFVSKAEPLPAGTRFLSGSGLAAGVVLFSAETASRSQFLGVLLLAAAGVALFLYNMYMAREGWKAQKKLERSFNSYRRATRVREKYGPLLLQYPGAKVVGIHELSKDRWELVVYFSDRESMENAIIASRNLEGIPVRKAVADAETVREIADRIGSYSESWGTGFAPGIGFVEYQYQRLRHGFGELKGEARYGLRAHPLGSFFAALVTAMTMASLGAVVAPLAAYLVPAVSMLYAAVKGLRGDHPVSTFFQLLTIGGYYMALAEQAVFGWPALLIPGALSTALAVWTLKGGPGANGRQVLGCLLNSLLMWMFTAIFLGTAAPPLGIALR